MRCDIFGCTTTVVEIMLENAGKLQIRHMTLDNTRKICHKMMLVPRKTLSVPSCMLKYIEPFLDSLKHSKK